jgi:hypothetical protein
VTCVLADPTAVHLVDDPDTKPLLLSPPERSGHRHPAPGLLEGSDNPIDRERGHGAPDGKPMLAVIRACRVSSRSPTPAAFRAVVSTSR